MREDGGMDTDIPAVEFCRTCGHVVHNLLPFCICGCTDGYPSRAGEVDETPDGEEIDTYTIWLDFGEQGETAITADLTKFNAAIKRLRRASGRDTPAAEG